MLVLVSSLPQRTLPQRQWQPALQQLPQQRQNIRCYPLKEQVSTKFTLPLPNWSAEDIGNDYWILECGGPLKPEVVQSTDFSPLYSAKSIFVLSGDKTDYWLAKHRKTEGQGFTMQVDHCPRVVVGCQIKNLGKGVNNGRITREFRVSGRIAKCHGSRKYISVKIWKNWALLILHLTAKTFLLFWKTDSPCKRFNILKLRLPGEKGPLGDLVGGWVGGHKRQTCLNPQLHLWKASEGPVPQVWPDQLLGKVGRWDSVLCCHSGHKLKQQAWYWKFFGNLQATSGIDNKLDTLKERSESFVTVLL